MLVLAAANPGATSWSVRRTRSGHARSPINNERTRCRSTPLLVLDGFPWRDGEIVGLHVSEFDEDQREGWTVSVIGRAHGTRTLRTCDDGPLLRGSRTGAVTYCLVTELVKDERLRAT